MKRKFRGLKPSELRWQCDPKVLRFDSIDDVKTCEGIIGQPRAIDAIGLGLSVKYPGYNIFATGPVGTGRTTAITKLLEQLEVEKDTLRDLLYVNNFQNPDMPRLIETGAGDGKKIRRSMLDLINDLKTSIPNVFSSENYQQKRQAIISKYENKQRLLVRDFEQMVEGQGFKLAQLQFGPITKPAILPVIEGKPAKLEEVEALVKEGRVKEQQYKTMIDKIREFEGGMAALYSKTRDIQDEVNAEIKKLNDGIVSPVVDHLIDGIRKRFKNKKLGEYLDKVREAIISGLDRFLKKEDKEEDFREFSVNILVDNAETRKIPIIFETNPSYKNLFGTIERYPAGPGIFLSDFLNIKAGSLLRANGGYLVINAFDALTEPGVWQALKRTLRNEMVDIQVFDPFYLFSTSALKPEPISIDVKIVMIGAQWLYYLLYYSDEDFKKIFKVKADFDTVMELSPVNINEYASFIKFICGSENLLSFSKPAIADIVEYGVRLAGRRDKLSTRFHVIADVVREADYWAKKAKRKTIQPDDVEQAIQAWRRRENMLEDKIQELIEKDILMIKTSGKVIGQVNGLSVYQVGGYSFGRPARITAKTSLGRAGIINIEREANLGGRTYNKGVLILGGFLRARYAQEQPMAIDATIGFEQSYSEVDGDSASSAEVYAILSALSGVPITQELAVTGSVNQNGEIQPIGGVNEKIEGFYEVCKAKGLNGKQGVIIPAGNVGDLMLKQEIVDTAARGGFHVHAVKTIDEGIEILTGVKAGKKLKKGYEEGSINYLVEKKLSEYAGKMKRFAQSK